eukprot:NODE_5397_length_1020_cov_7.937570_g4828_i0.p2 GENE.NODE_5397_length_1020_cov_7.937570_g4828_i0~~NODE_5397_length_1020_cov_7.937570_g4828_i0.p2  ORF type:complete len:153 (+),score=29.76 NODE_5397_length_1020_cov_7.937570_g4828_i0:534-992(+)
MLVKDFQKRMKSRKAEHHEISKSFLQELKIVRQSSIAVVEEEEIFICPPSKSIPLRDLKQYGALLNEEIQNDNMFQSALEMEIPMPRSSDSLIGISSNKVHSPIHIIGPNRASKQRTSSDGIELQRKKQKLRQLKEVLDQRKQTTPTPTSPK